MPKNKGKGGKNRRRGKNENEGTKRELVYKSEGQAYGQVTCMLGGGRLQVYCFDGQSRLAHIRGKLRKKIWINQGDIILLSLRSFQDDKCDVMLKYTPDEARALKSCKEIPEGAKINEFELTGDPSVDKCVFEFENDDGGKSSSDDDDDDSSSDSDFDKDDIDDI